MWKCQNNISQRLIFEFNYKWYKYHFLYETLSIALFIFDFRTSQILKYSYLYFLVSFYCTLSLYISSLFLRSQSVSDYFQFTLISLKLELSWLTSCFFDYNCCLRANNYESLSDIDLPIILSLSASYCLSFESK